MWRRYKKGIVCEKYKSFHFMMVKSKPLVKFDGAIFMVHR